MTRTEKQHQSDRSWVKSAIGGLVVALFAGVFLVLVAVVVGESSENRELQMRVERLQEDLDQAERDRAALLLNVAEALDALEIISDSQTSTRDLILSLLRDLDREDRQRLRERLEGVDEQGNPVEDGSSGGEQRRGRVESGRERDDPDPDDPEPDDPEPDDPEPDDPDPPDDDGPLDNVPGIPDDMPDVCIDGICLSDLQEVIGGGAAGGYAPRPWPRGPANAFPGCWDSLLHCWPYDPLTLSWRFD